MIVSIGGSEYELNFGIRFVRELDAAHCRVLDNGIRIGMGLEECVPQLVAGIIVTLEEVIYAATCTAKKRPTQDEMDDFIDACDDVDKLIDEVLGELKKQNATKKQTAELVARTNAAVKLQKAAARTTNRSSKK